MDYYYDYYDLMDFFSGAIIDGSAAIIVYSIFVSLIGLFFTIVSIAFIGAMLTRISHKLKIYEKETLAYIPVLCDCYRMRMVGYHPVMGLLINANGIVISLLVAILSLVLFKSLTLALILFIAGLIVDYYFTYKYYNRILRLFGFDGALALLVFIPGLSFVLTIIGMIVAFSDKFDCGAKDIDNRFRMVEQKVANIGASGGGNMVGRGTGKGTISGIRGKYLGSSFEIRDGEVISMGRDAQKCNIVFEEKYHSISGFHCTIRYAAAENAFYVTDTSTNGTFTGDGMKIGKNATRRVEAGSIINLADESNSFRLG